MFSDSRNFIFGTAILWAVTFTSPMLAGPDCDKEKAKGCTEVTKTVCVESCSKDKKKTKECAKECEKVCETKCSKEELKKFITTCSTDSKKGCEDACSKELIEACLKLCGKDAKDCKDLDHKKLLETCIKLCAKDPEACQSKFYHDAKKAYVLLGSKDDKGCSSSCSKTCETTCSSGKLKSCVETCSTKSGKAECQISTCLVAGDGEEASIQIVIANDDVKVIIDGEEVDEDRIILKGDRVIILDEDGDVLREFKTWNEGSGSWTFSGDDLKNLWVEEYTPYTDKAKDMYLKALGEKEDLQFQFKFDEAKMPKVMLGVMLDSPSEALCCQLQLEPGTATYIQEVFEGLPADKAGLKNHDIIVKIAGCESACTETLHKVLSEKEPGDTLKIAVMRGGEIKKLAVELEAYDPMVMSQGNVFEVDELELGELDLSEIREKVLKNLGEGYTEIYVAPEKEKQKIQEFIFPKKMKFDEKDLEARLEELQEQLEERLEELEEMLEELLEELEENS